MTAAAHYESYPREAFRASLVASDSEYPTTMVYILIPVTITAGRSVLSIVSTDFIHSFRRARCVAKTWRYPGLRNFGSMKPSRMSSYEGRRRKGNHNRFEIPVQRMEDSITTIPQGFPSLSVASIPLVAEGFHAEPGLSHHVSPKALLPDGRRRGIRSPSIMAYHR